MAKAKGLWAPRSEGQQLAMQRAASAGGDPTGDPRANDASGNGQRCGAGRWTIWNAMPPALRWETPRKLESLTALPERNKNRRLQNRPRHLPIGSVKSNLGHLAGSRRIGRNGQMFDRHEDASELSPLPFNFPTTPRKRTIGRKLPFCEWSIASESLGEPWIAGRQAGVSPRVNAFGIGGLNAHAVVERRDGAWRAVHAASDPSSDRQIQPVSPTSPLRLWAAAWSCPALRLDRSISPSYCLTATAACWDRHRRDAGRPVDGIRLGLASARTRRCGFHRATSSSAVTYEIFKFDAQSVPHPSQAGRQCESGPADDDWMRSGKPSQEFDGGNWSIDRQTRRRDCGFDVWRAVQQRTCKSGLRLPELGSSTHSIRAAMQGWRGSEHRPSAWAETTIKKR